MAVDAFFLMSRVIVRMDVRGHSRCSKRPLERSWFYECFDHYIHNFFNNNYIIMNTQVVRSKECTEIVPPSKAPMLMEPGILRIKGDAVQMVMDWFDDGFLMHSIYLLPFQDRIRVFALLIDEDGNGIHILLNVVDPMDFDLLWDKHRNGADLLRSIVQDDILCDVILTHHDTFKVNRGLVDSPVWEYTL